MLTTFHKAVKAEGFIFAGVTAVKALPQAAQYLQEFINEGAHGSMGWMDQPRRFSPEYLWQEAKTAIMLAMPYTPPHDPLHLVQQKDKGNISVYARGADYHTVIKKKLKRLARLLVEEHDCEVKLFIDTAPLMEKPLAQQAGMGWQGKHTNLVSREMGSWFFIASIFTTLDLPLSNAETDHCGKCRACLDICPTDAFPAPYKLDARRCISYLTIEHKGVIAPEFRKAMGNRIYGCDDCLAVCPWNKYAKTAHEEKLHARPENQAPALLALLTLDDAGFRQRFTASAIKRIGRDRFIRNVLIALGNSSLSDPTPLVPFLRDPSPLVRGMAIWALAQIDRAYIYGVKEEYQRQETDAEVMAEWNALS